jgi:major membrane immunogen (membrane-anchored lipoprotein)
MKKLIIVLLVISMFLTACITSDESIHKYHIKMQNGEVQEISYHLCKDVTVGFSPMVLEVRCYNSGSGDGLHLADATYMVVEFWEIKDDN